MITKIINTLRSSERPLSLKELSDALDTDASALEGMLEYLLLKEKIMVNDPESINPIENDQTIKCGGCHENPYCPSLLNRQLTYQIDKKSQSNNSL